MFVFKKEGHMKFQWALILNLMMGLQSTFAQQVHANTAQYFRVWQGFTRSDLSHDTFMEKLPSFMEATVVLYKGKGLNNYFVIVPPKEKSKFIPDELALVAFESEQAYKTVRETPAGQAYSNSHWEIFNKETSKSDSPKLPMQLPEKLENNKAYGVLGDLVDWTQGYTTAFIGERRDGEFSKEAFLDKLLTHVVLAKNTFSKLGLKGYVILSNEEYEVAYMNWESKLSLEEALKTEGGKAVVNDGNSFLNPIFYRDDQTNDKTIEGKGAKTFEGKAEENSFYTTVRPD